jgi:hypothetical protein
VGFRPYLCEFSAHINLAVSVGWCSLIWIEGVGGCGLSMIS